jgi:chemotaxis protein CheD
MSDWKKILTATNCAATGGRIDLHLEVAQKRLWESTDQSDALEAIREIVTNLLGSEEIAVFKVEQEGTVLSLFWAFGIDPERHEKLDAWRSPVLQRVIEGEPYLEGAFEEGENGSPVAGFKTLVPLRLASQTVAVLAIRQLLLQKTCFDESDLQLLRLLSEDAGKVLFREEASR